MSDIKIQPSATGSATVTLTAPATSTARTVTLPDGTGTLIADNGSGSVGIGETTPLAKLHIKRGDSGLSSLNAAGDHIFLENTGANGTGITLASGNTANGSIIFGDQDSNYRGVLIYDHSLDAMKIVTAGTERMRIDYNGNVGIGVTPEGWHSNYKALQIGNTGTLFKDNANGGDFSIGNNFYLNSTPAYAYTTTAEASRHSQENGIHYFQVAASGSADSAITWTDCLKVWNNSATGPGFTVGTHNTNGSDKGYSCHIENNIIGHRNTAKLTDQQTHWRFYNPNGQVGNINTSGSGTNYVTSSDYRLKENINYDWDATTRLKQLKPARFNFIADDTNTLVDGFIAHEVSSVVPEAISGAKDAVDANGDIDPQGIDQSKLVPLLVKTIQELEARITTLEG